jgi:hypothetical protein
MRRTERGAPCAPLRPLLAWSQFQVILKYKQNTMQPIIMDLNRHLIMICLEDEENEKKDYLWDIFLYGDCGAQVRQGILEGNNFFKKVGC